MSILIGVIAVLWIALATFLILYTKETKGFLMKYLYTKDVKLLAIIPAVLGIILVIGALLRREMFWLAFILGVLAIGKGAYLAFGPPAQVREILDWWFYRATDKTLRMSGLVSFILACSLLSYAF
jgi:hypothetical protein